MKIKISRKQWQEMGKKAGWMKKADIRPANENPDFGGTGERDYSKLIAAIKDPSLRGQFPAIQPAGWQQYETMLGQLGEDGLQKKFNEKPSAEFMANEQKRVQQMNEDNARRRMEEQRSKPRSPNYGNM